MFSGAMFFDSHYVAVAGILEFSLIRSEAKVFLAQFNNEVVPRPPLDNSAIR